MTRPPVVGVLCGRSPHERYSTHRGYVSSITAAGGTPILLPAGPDADPQSLSAVVNHCQAIVITGGGDVDPDAYGGASTSSADLLMEVDPARDATEFAVVQYAMAQGKRVLGICRGAQLLAVVGGGTLVPDLIENGLPGHWDEERQYEAVHPIAAEPGSLAAGVLGTIAQVNSIHHQAIADPGQSVRPTAWSPDGVIEAIEGPGLLGVQWHPERMTGTDRRHLAAFSWVVQ
jgi:putative glutamine amidotransferase